MKIAVNTRLLLPRHLDETGTFTHEILRRLTVNNPQHEFYFLFDRPYHPRFIYAKNVHPLVVSPPARNPFLVYLWLQVRLAQTLKKLQPDVFFSTDGMTILNTPVPRVTVINQIGNANHGHKPGFTSRQFYKYYKNRFVQASHKIIAFSEYARQRISQLGGVELNQILVVPRPGDPVFRPINFENQVAVRLTYTSGEAYFLGIFALQPADNLINLLQAFDSFKLKTGNEVKLVLVENKKFLARSQRQVWRQMQYKDEVIFTGHLSQAALRKLYGAAVATVYLPDYESPGTAVLEAQQCGCPVITCPTGAGPEVAAGGALVLNPADATAITTALIQVYHQVEVRARLVQTGTQQAQRFSWDESADKIMRWLETTVKTAAHGPAIL